MAKEKKSTIKFQKNKLKGVVKRRKEVNKLKRQIIKRQLRRGGKDQPKATEEEGTKEEETEEEKVPEVSIEDYFVNFVIESEEPLDLSDDEEEELNALDEFESLAVADATNGADRSDEEMEEEESEDDEDEYSEEEDMEQDDGEMIGEPVTMAMLNEWITAANTQKSPIAWKKMLMAFRYVVRSDDEETKTDFTYRVDSSKVYTKLIRYTLKAAYPILSQHIYFLKKERYPGKTKNWPKLEKVIRLFLNNCVRFLRELTQDDIIQYVLEQLEPCALYFGCFPKISREYLRVLLDRWSDTGLSEETRSSCIKAIQQLGTEAIDANKKNYMPNVLKGVYLIFANRATKVNAGTLPMIQQMLQEAAQVYNADHKASFEHADAYIRQLADHLKKAKKANTVESFKQIYTWQYIGCLDFWASVVGVTCDPALGLESSPMQTIVHPLVELCLHTIRLNPTAQFLPLRMHLLGTLIGLIDTTGYYIPLAPFLFEILGSDIFKGSSGVVQGELPEFEWELHLKVPKAYVQSRIYQDAVYNIMYDNMVNFYACFGMSIAFPELAIPAIDKLKEHTQKMKGTRFVKTLRTLIEKLDNHKNYIEQKRAPIEYAANKLDEANAFLRSTNFDSTPLGGFLKKRNQ
ncbi:Noc2-domain-containing protein [Backusella circina FSU 941]|nr:Noc2-domain-containing protein [Backusella circina FSU 941]